MKKYPYFLWLIAIVMVLVPACKDSEEDELIGDYKYYLNIQSQVALNLNEEDEEQGTMSSNSKVDLMSKTIFFMKKAVVDNDSQQGGSTKAKEATLLTVCDSLYHNYAVVNPENKGHIVCYVKLIRTRLDSDGTAKDPVTLKYYKFWTENDDNGNDNDDPTPNEYLAKPDSLKAIDLGLSVLWANCNIGAQQPRDYGAHLAWGDPTGKLWSGEGIYWKNDGYAWNTNNYGGKNPPEDITGSPLDVVTLNWGEGWRIPSYYDAKELCEQCQWKLRTSGDIKWYEVIGPNGNSIIMPLAGNYGDDLSSASARFHTGPHQVNVMGLYWTSTICPTPASAEVRGYGVNSGVATAWMFYCNSSRGDLNGSNMFLDQLRAMHLSIRPVHDK